MNERVNVTLSAMSMGQSSTASIAPALAYAETTTMSYPDASRGGYAINQQFTMSPAVTSTFTQSANKTAATTAASKAPVAANPMFNTSVQQMYNPTFPYMVSADFRLSHLYRVLSVQMQDGAIGREARSVDRLADVSVFEGLFIKIVISDVCFDATIDALHELVITPDITNRHLCIRILSAQR